VSQPAFFGLGNPLFDNLAFVDIRGTFLSETTAALEQGACLAQGLLGRVAADAFHSGVPGRNPPQGVHRKDTVGHGIDDHVEKTGVPDGMGLGFHGVSFLVERMALP
jgi:hypothetical protein